MTADGARAQCPLTLVDLLIFAPIGLAAVAVQRLPCLVDKTREHAVAKVGAARVVGEFAVRFARQELGKYLERSDSANDADDAAAMVPAESPADALAQVTASPRSSEHLAIPGYDSLAASQVVGRLRSLSPPDLEAIRTYEAVTRHRRTILHRIDELLR